MGLQQRQVRTWQNIDPSYKFKSLPKQRAELDAIGQTQALFTDAVRTAYLTQFRSALPYEYYEGLVQNYLRTTPGAACGCGSGRR